MGTCYYQTCGCKFILGFLGEMLAFLIGTECGTLRCLRVLFVGMLHYKTRANDYSNSERSCLFCSTVGVRLNIRSKILIIWDPFMCDACITNDTHLLCVGCMHLQSVFF